MTTMTTYAMFACGDNTTRNVTAMATYGRLLVFLAAETSFFLSFLHFKSWPLNHSAERLLNFRFGIVRL